MENYLTYLYVLKSDFPQALKREFFSTADGTSELVPFPFLHVAGVKLSSFPFMLASTFLLR
jgi:hypothetical protein